MPYSGILLYAYERMCELDAIKMCLLTDIEQWPTWYDGVTVWILAVITELAAGCSFR